MTELTKTNTAVAVDDKPETVTIYHICRQQADGSSIFSEVHVFPNSHIDKAIAEYGTMDAWFNATYDTAIYPTVYAYETVLTLDEYKTDHN